MSLSTLNTAQSAPLTKPQLPELSIIVPTYQEAPNIPLLTNSIAETLNPIDINYEILFVDDNSQDGTEDICENLKEDHPVTLITRKNTRGLSSAVLEGFKHAKGQYLLVMDCDLSHPANAIPAMLNALKSGEADFVLGSRYTEGGSIHSNWNWLRQLNSKIPSWLSQPLSPLKDPMSGFFAFQRDALPESQSLSPLGYKIALEIFVKGSFKSPIEIPIHFSERVHGHSKLTTKERLLFLRHLGRLYKFQYSEYVEFFQFGLVGLSGFIIDLLFFITFQIFGLSHLAARACSFIVAASWNWFLNRTFTFSHYQQQNKLSQWPKFLLTSTIGFAINWGSYLWLTGEVYYFDEHRIEALIVGVLMGTMVNFFTSKLFVFNTSKTYATDSLSSANASANRNTAIQPASIVKNKA